MSPDRGFAEAEADRIADRVTRPSSRSAPPAPQVPGAAPGGPVPGASHVGAALSSPSRPVDPALAERVRGVAGHDVSRVRIHSEDAATASAAALGALAYTLGTHVVVRADRYRVGTPAGDRLIAHELVHTVQQARGHLALQRQDDPAATGSTADDDLDVDPGAPAPDAGVGQGAVPGAGVAPDAGTTPDAGTAAATAISASVGRRGVNRPADVAAVQDRLEALGLLTAEQGAAERPDQAEPERPVAEGSLPQTIAAIERFQQPLGFTDGNVGPTGPTWRALTTMDAAAFAARQLAWQQAEQARSAAAGRAAGEAEARRAADAAAAGAAAQELARTKGVTGLIATYATTAGGLVLNLDEAGLGTALRQYAGTYPTVVEHVLGQLPSVDRDDVAYEITHAATDAELAGWSSELRGLLRAQLAGGVTFPAETAEIARLDAAAGPPAAAAVPAAPEAGGPGLARTGGAAGYAAAVVDAPTLEGRVQQIRAWYDTYWVPRASTGNCHLATKAALEKMGWTVGGGDTSFVNTPQGDAPLTAEQNAALTAALLEQIRAGNPVEIGVDYQAGHPGNVDTKTDHWLYVVAVTVDDNGRTVLVAYDNADVAASTITHGNVVFFTLDEMGRFYHPPYFPTSQKAFSNQPHVIVNFRPAHRVP